MNNLKLTWKLPFIALLGIILLFTSSCNPPKPFNAKDFEGLHYSGDTVHLSYEEAVPGKETRTWCSGNTWEKDICTPHHVDTTFVIQGKPVDPQMAADGWNAKVYGFPINWTKYLGWVPLIVAILLGLLLLALGLALLGVLRDAWRRFLQPWPAPTTIVTAPAAPASAPPATEGSATPVGHPNIAGNDQYFLSLPKGTRVEMKIGNGTGFVSNGDRPAGT